MLSLPSRLTGRLWLACALLVGSATTLHAETIRAYLPAPPSAPSEEATRWAGSLALGFFRNNSDSNSTTLNYNGELGYHGDTWSNFLSSKGNYTHKDHHTSTQNWQLADQIRRDLGDDTYSFGAFNYLNDRFAGIRQRLSETVGLGRTMVNSDRQKLDMGIGGGIGHSREAFSKSWDTRPVAMLLGTYRIKMGDIAEFKQKLLLESSTKNTYINPVSEFKLFMTKNLFVNFAYEMRHNTDVPVKSRKTNTITSINMGYDFGTF